MPEPMTDIELAEQQAQWDAARFIREQARKRWLYTARSLNAEPEVTDVATIPLTTVDEWLERR